MRLSGRRLRERALEGSLVDLLAADAFGLCAPYWRTTAEDTPNDGDAYLDYLEKTIDKNPCPSSVATSSPTLPQAATWNTGTPSKALKWVWDRTHFAQCNVDSGTGLPVLLGGGTTAPAAPSPYALDTTSLSSRWAAYDLMSVLYSAGDAAPVLAAKKEAAQELGLAGMNFCMASRLRESMLSADVLLASGESQRQLLEAIRERAQLALLQYTALGLAFTNTTSDNQTPTTFYQIMPALRKFYTTTKPLQQLHVLARDYAQTLRLYIDATTELTELFGRSAAAGADLTQLGGAATSQTAAGAPTTVDLKWGDGTWRSRTMNLLYGGDPLGTVHNHAASSFNATWGGAAGFSGTYYLTNPGIIRPHVTTSVQGPEPFALLGLARQADAIYLAYDSTLFKLSPDLTGKFLYTAVEASLRRQSCLRANPTAACVFYADDTSTSSSWPTSISGTTTDYSNAELWRRYRINPSHAASLAQLLIEMVPRDPSDGGDDRNTVLFSGQQAYVDKPPQLQVDAVDRWLHLAKDFSATDLPSSLLSAAFVGNDGFFMPWYSAFPTWQVPGGFQGFVQRRTANIRGVNPAPTGPAGQAPPITPLTYPYGAGNSSARYLGVVPTLSAVRDGFLLGKSIDTASPYYEYSDAMLAGLSAAVGPSSFAIRPYIVRETVTGNGATSLAPCPDGATSCTVFVQNTTDQTATGKAMAVIHVVRPSTAPNAEIIVIDKNTWTSALKNQTRYVANAALSSTFVAPDFDAITATSNTTGLSQAALNTCPGSAAAGCLPTSAIFPLGNAITVSTPSGTYKREIAVVQWTRNDTGPMPNAGVIILLRTTATPYDYVVLGDGTGIRAFNTSLQGQTRLTTGWPVIYSTDGRYGSFGGAFNAKAARAYSTQAPNFAKPALDPFGLPTNWLPPTSPDLFGGNQGEDAVSFYLRSAETAADGATTAVRTALDSVIAEKADSQKLQAERDQAQQIGNLEVQKLCNASSCDSSTTGYILKTPPACTTDACTVFQQQLDLGCSVLTVVAGALSNHDVAPSFAQFGGSDMQRLALNQWRAVRAIEDEEAAGVLDLEALSMAANAARDQADAVDLQIAQTASADAIAQDAAYQRQTYACDPKRGVEAIKAETSYSSGTSGTPPASLAQCSFLMQLPWSSLLFSDTSSCLAAFPSQETGVNSGSSYNSGPMDAANAACKDAQIAFSDRPFLVGPNWHNLQAAAQDFFAKAQQVNAALAGHMSRLVSLRADFQTANVGIQEATSKLDVALKQNAIDSAATQLGYASQLELSSRYHQYDFWRARALLEDARHLATAARRAIEGRFVVDLSEMKADEPFVAAPSLWADEVYSYDLDAPAAVGLSIAPPPAAGQATLYPNKLSDYVHNLQNFVQGYSVQRPTAVAVGDTEVISIPGPEAKNTDLVRATGETILADGAPGWSFQCADGQPWLTNPAGAPPGKADINWKFTKNLAAPFENEGFGQAISLAQSAGGNPLPSGPSVAPGGRAMNFVTGSTLMTGATTVGESTTGVTALTWVNMRTFNATRGTILGKMWSSGSPLQSVALATSGTAGTWTSQIMVAGTANVVTVSAAPIPKDKWVQLGMTFDGRVERAYLNGVEVGNFQVVAPTLPPVAIDWGGHERWTMGARFYPPTEFIDGWVGPTIIDRSVFTADTIAKQYAKTRAELGPSEAWQFKEAGAPYASLGSAGALPMNAVGGTAPVAAVSSPVGTPAVDFNGTTATLQTAATSLGESPSEITLSAWVYVRNGTGASIDFIAKSYNPTTWAAPYASVMLSESAAGLLTGFVNSGGTLWSGGAAAGVPRNQWAHIALTFDGARIRVYLNGVSVVNTGVGVSTPALIDWGAHGPWAVGGNPPVLSETLNGMMADVRVEPRARSASEISDLYYRGRSGTCYLDDVCVGNLDCCADKTSASPLRTLCNGKPPALAKVAFQLDPWGRQGDYYANPPYKVRHNVRWGRMAVNLVGSGVRDCSLADDTQDCYANSFLRYDFTHTGPSWVMSYDSEWRAYGLPIARAEGAKALATEEWLDPISNNWSQPFVASVQRDELRDRPLDGSYDITLTVTPDVRLDRIERVQVLSETNYWVREQ